ncbi:SCL-interrupting locus protein-like [Pollicipes pollicipes]|uniref:SCL-interrupting locus protein-like n=1 Tax=Pollicipes pollicipes TaxID=41117 RepID=UPI0018850CD6|nr:SCL-interrupting locus protein-like [Pollicipes pollicipes]
MKALLPPAVAAENTAQVQQRRVQEWVDGRGWAVEETDLTLRGVVLPPVPEQAPSPEQSLHVQMQEYQPSGDGSAGGSAAEEEAETERAKPDKTFFQNVMGQVNQILNAYPAEPERPATPPKEVGPPRAAASSEDPVRRATLQQLRAAGVSLAPSQTNERSVFDYSCVPRAARPSAAVPCSSDLSLEINTLAMKYVDSRQLLQRAGAVGGRPSPHPVEARLLGKENLTPPPPGRPTDMTVYGISDSNMSFSTRKYMEKFNLQS